MKRNKTLSCDKKLLILLGGVIILPPMIKLLIKKGFQFHFDQLIWHELIDMMIILLIMIPLSFYLIKRTHRFEKELTDQFKQNEKMTEALEEKTEQLSHMAYYDVLTGLPNRYKLFNILNHLIETHQHKDYKIAVLFLYIDQFEVLNNVIGHELNDDLIKHMTQKLKKVTTNKTILSKYSSNEFIIILSDTTEEECLGTASRIIDLFSKPFFFNQDDIYTTANMGISMYPHHGKDAETLIKHADIAMYLTKNNPGSNYQLYSHKLDKDTDRKIKLIKGLSQVIEENQLIVHYQPQVDLNTGQLDGVEALVRWNHPELGLISPDEFISLAEKTGDIIPIGNWVLREACQQTKYWQERFAIDINIAVNVSVRQIEEPCFLTYLQDVLEQTGLNPTCLEIEITESMMLDLEETHAIFNQLKEIGVKIAIDDFGTGYSSLSVLGFLPIDYLKIDRSFTKDMLRQAKINSIVKTIINMGKSLQIKVIAEGVEEQEQLCVLRKYRCDIGQGYYYSRPLSAEEIENKWLLAKASMR